MANLPHFVATETWQELTGVSGVNAKFTIQNIGGFVFYIYIGITPNVQDSNQISNSAYLENDTAEQVWVLAESNTVKIAIQQGA